MDPLPAQQSGEPPSVLALRVRVQLALAHEPLAGLHLRVRVQLALAHEPLAGVY
jgi:hypothetical protein